MVLFKSGRRDWALFKKCLYIPIWFYSNVLHIFTLSFSISLHSNMVLFKFLLQSKWIWSMKTLHSNMVLFKCILQLILLHVCKTLHSNMVLFKWIRPVHFRTRRNLYIPIWFYSNQAKNQKNHWKIALHSNMVLFKSNWLVNGMGWNNFTFQYGSIQI